MLVWFHRADLLKNYEKQCEGVNGGPTRIQMPEKGENTLSFRNHHKQMKTPYVVYADFEALVKKIPGCERNPGAMTSFTEKTEMHETCSFSYIVVRSDVKGLNDTAVQPMDYRGENAVEVFLKAVVEEEAKMREEMGTPKPLAMTNVDWWKHRNATACHICNKSLIVDTFLDSMSVHDQDTGKHCGQSQKSCGFVEYLA